MQERYGEEASRGITSQFVVLDGHVSTEILAFIEERSVDLVVMGSYGLSGMGLVLFGSVTKRVSQKASCSVMIVRTTD
jgi:universal stress protein A